MTDESIVPETPSKSEVRAHIIEDHGGWIEVRLNDGSDVTDADLLLFRDDLTAIPKWREKPFLIHMGALRSVSRDARQRIGRYRHPTRIAVLGTTPMDRVMAHFIIRSTRAQYFSTRHEALHWLGVNDSRQPYRPGGEGPP